MYNYVLIDYKSPEYEILAFDMLIRRLIDIGYPEVSYELAKVTRLGVYCFFFAGVVAAVL